MDVVVPFAAALVSLRLAAALLRRREERRAPELVTWAASLGAFAVASAALAWGAASGWDELAFRVYYLFGGLLTAALLGAGSLQRAGVRIAGPAVLLYVGICIGMMLAVELRADVAADGIPAAADVLEFAPARALAVAGNVAGTIAAVGVAVLGLRRRPLGNALILGGVASAALGSALTGLGESGSALFALVAALLLFAGFVARA